MKPEEPGKKSEEMAEVRISVRTLVEFLLRSGDLVKGRSALADRGAMQAGSRAHRRIQGRRGASYRAEVPLLEQFDYPGDGDAQDGFLPCPPFRLVIEGRADGIDEKENETVVEEIKGIYQNPDDLEGPVPVHLAQAKCYAAIFGKQNHLDTIRIRMTYCSLEDDTTRSFCSVWNSKELWNWFAALADQYMQWARMKVRWNRIRNRSAAGLEFPFPYRAGQRDMTAAVYQTIRQGRQLFVQAPTGIGKTMSAVFPAVHALSRGMGEKLFYLTAKTVARTVAEEAFAILKNNGLSVRSLTVTAKEKLCVMPEVNCSPESCPRARGHFDRVNEALMDLLLTADDFSRENILAQSGKFSVCPYELQLDLAEFADCVICDYNYVFDPDAKISRYFGETAGKGKALLLVDEAHNLADRGREMYSASLGKEEILAVRRLIAGEKSAQLKKISAALTACNRSMLKLKKTCAASGDAEELFGSRCMRMESIGDLLIPFLNLAGLLEEYLTGKPQADTEEALTEFYFTLRSFLARYEELGDGDRIYAILSGDGRFSVRIACMNPAPRLQKILDKCRSAVFFSATLFPIRYYEELLTTRTDSYRIYIPSPFDRKKRLIAVGGDVSTRYKQRGPAEYMKIAGYIDAVTGTRRGNYLIFFPSYRMMEEVLELFLSGRGMSGEEAENGGDGYRVYDSDDLRVIAQRPGMSEENRGRFLSEFSGGGGTMAAFCVMGGIFAEGIDLAGEKLIGAVIVGTGLPQISAEREILRRYYDENGRDGFDFAYRYPGMNKVLQSAGRVIRTDEDTGVILLLDGRFLQRESLALLPREWNDLVVVDERSVKPCLEDFWKKQDG